LKSGQQKNAFLDPVTGGGTAEKHPIGSTGP
jgi:hypothetical protein